MGQNVGAVPPPGVSPSSSTQSQDSAQSQIDQAFATYLINFATNQLYQNFQDDANIDSTDD